MLKMAPLYESRCAQCVELFAWLGWLRSSEIFNMRLDDVEMVPPAQGVAYNLSSGTGAILLKLLASTKSSRNKKVDVVIAWQTASGLCFGFWLSRLLSILHELNWDSPSSYLFRTNANTPWTSHYFRAHNMHPLLHLQHLNGDVTFPSY